MCVFYIDRHRLIDWNARRSSLWLRVMGGIIMAACKFLSDGLLRVLSNTDTLHLFFFFSVDHDRWLHKYISI